MPNTNTTVNENKLFRTNSITIVGTLIEVNKTYGNRKDNGQGYISVDATISSNINGEANEYKVSFFASQLTKDNKTSKLYESYENMDQLLNRKVQVDGEIRENRYFSTALNQLNSTQLLSGKFIKGVVDTTPDVAKFTLGGVLVKTPVEKKNKKDEVYRYDVTIGQSNFRGDGMNMFTLHINPVNREILAGVQDTYNIGDTIQFDGTLCFKVETVTVEDENTAFGAPVVKTYTNRQSNFYIGSGSNPITEEGVAYSPEVTTKLINAYKAHDVEIQAAAANAPKASGTSFSAEATTSPTPVVTKRQTSLI